MHRRGVRVVPCARDLEIKMGREIRKIRGCFIYAPRAQGKVRTKTVRRQLWAPTLNRPARALAGRDFFCAFAPPPPSDQAVFYHLASSLKYAQLKVYLHYAFGVGIVWQHIGNKSTENMPADRSLVAPMPAACRSARTNGRRLFVDGDGRGPWARRWRDLKFLYADDIGGESSLSEFQLGLVGTAATLRCELEKLEGRLSVGEAVDLDQFGRLAGHYRRIVETLGLERRTRDVTPSLADIAAEIEAEREAAGS
jgi:hypothetical protein